MLRYLLVPASLVGSFAAPALAQENPAPFKGPRVEAVAGTDGKLTAGVGLGYDFGSGGAVFGLEGEVLASLQSDCETLNANTHDRLCQKTQRDLYVGGRIGVALGAGTLLYGKAGYTNLRLRETYDPGTSGGTAFRFSRDLDGVRVGAGLEQKLGGNAYVKGEYRYSNYEAGNWKHEGVIGLGIRF